MQLILIDDLEGEAVGRAQDWVGDGLAQQLRDALGDPLLDPDCCETIAIAEERLVMGVAVDGELGFNGLC